MSNHNQRALWVSRGPTWILLLVALAGVAAHFLTAGRYGIFRDELYYLDCARHLDWGYVDHPPLSIGLLKLSVALLGDSQFAIRVLPALAGALVVILTGLLAARFGADRFGVFLAALAALLVPVYLINTGYFSMNGFELMFWALLYLMLALLLSGASPKLWLVFGAVLGLAMLNKVGVVALVVGLVPALLFTGHGRQLKNRYFWLGAAVAALLFLPHLLWQMAHGWPTVEFVRHATERKIVALSPWSYLSEQVLMMGPLNLLVWAPGLVLLLWWPRLKPYRALGVLWLCAYLFFALQRGKPYYLSPAYPPLLAAGAVGLAHVFAARLRWMRVALVALMLTAGAVVAPLTLPLLAPDRLVLYLDEIGLHPNSGETSEEAALPQYFADRFGWEHMAATVAQAYHHLPDSLRASCTIIATNYGEAGALNYYAGRYRLPRTICQHNSYYLWGSNGTSGEVLLAVNYSREQLTPDYESVTLVAAAVSEWTMPFEADVPIHLCTGLKRPWLEAWQEGRFYY